LGTVEDKMATVLRFATPLLIVLLALRPASAESIQIIGGTLTTSTFTAPDFRAQYSLVLNEGLLEGQWPGGTVSAISCIGGCTPGTSVSVMARWFNPEQPSVLVPPPTGTLQIGDLTAGPFFSGVLMFGGDAFVLPEVDPALIALGEVTLRQPFSFSGSVTAYPARISGTFVPEPQISVDLIGSGTAHLRFGLDTLPSGATSYRYRDSSYEFAPVPEPASLMMVATGLGALWSRRRRRTG
jgi:hypothetical protein